jgi:hypothetical protein
MHATSTAARPNRSPARFKPRTDFAPTNGDRTKSPKPEPKILFQKYFKSVGPRTYAAQLMQAGNGNHYLVLTEGKRDDKTGEVRKTKLFLFSEDFEAFEAMLKEMFAYMQAHPVPKEVRKKRERFWAKQRDEQSGSRQEHREANVAK